MKLTIISNEINIIRKSGFAFLFSDHSPVGYGTAFPEHYTQNMCEDDRDALYDNDAVLCVDENGEYYGATIGWDGERIVPTVWQKLYHIGEIEEAIL